MEPLLSGALTAKLVAGTWVMREAFSCLLKWRKQEKEEERRRREEYKPDETWKQYCIERFDDLRDAATKSNTALEVIKVQLGYFEKMIFKLKGERR